MTPRAAAAAVAFVAAAAAAALGSGSTPGSTRESPALSSPAVQTPTHELFLRPRGFFVAPGATITLPVFDGAFTASARAVPVAGIADLSRLGPGESRLGPGGRATIARGTWAARDSRSTVRVAFDGPGTYVVGLAVGGRTAKALIAVTDPSGHLAPAPRDRASAALTPLGYDAEIVPLVDPYTVGVGATIAVRALIGGKPLAGVPIRAGGTIGTSTAPVPVQALTTDRDGRADVRITHDGHWYVAFVRGGARGSDAADDVRAATMTFGVMRRAEGR